MEHSLNPWIYLRYPCGKEPLESIWRGEAKLGRCLGELSVRNMQADQLDLLLPVWRAQSSLLVWRATLVAHHCPMVYSNAARCLIKLLLKSIGSKVQTSDYNNKTSLSFNTIRCLHCHHSSNETTACTLQHAVIKGLLIKYPQHLMLLICHFFH